MSALPSNVTSIRGPVSRQWGLAEEPAAFSSLLAARWAEAICKYWSAASSRGHLDLTSPVCVLDLVPASGKFVWQMIAALHAHIPERIGFPLAFRYVACARDNAALELLGSNPLLKALIRQDRLSLALWNYNSEAPEFPDDARALKSMVRRNPLAVVAHDAWGRLEQRLYGVHYGARLSAVCKPGNTEAVDWQPLGTDCATRIGLALSDYQEGINSCQIWTLSDSLLIPASLYGMPFQQALSVAFARMFQAMLELILPYLLIVVVVGIGAEMLQTGVLFSFKALTPSGKKLDVASNLKQMFAMKNFIEFLKSLLKVAVIIVVVCMLVRDAIDPLIKMPASGVLAVGHTLGALLTTMIIYTTAAYAVIAFADFAYQRYAYIKGLMMSIEEVKQEYKQMEGDPHIKSKRKHLAQEMAMEGMVDKTRKASVVVTNPTHIAIAIYYEAEETPLPVVVAKGQDLLAHRMIAIAHEEGIPVMQNIPLARALMRTAVLDRYIPSELVEPVAEVLRGLDELIASRDGGEGYES